MFRCFLQISVVLLVQHFCLPSPLGWIDPITIETCKAFPPISFIHAWYAYTRTHLHARARAHTHTHTHTHLHKCMHACTYRLPHEWTMFTISLNALEKFYKFIMLCTKLQFNGLSLQFNGLSSQFAWFSFSSATSTSKELFNNKCRECALAATL